MNQEQSIWEQAARNLVAMQELSGAIENKITDLDEKAYADYFMESSYEDR